MKPLTAFLLLALGVVALAAGWHWGARGALSARDTLAAGRPALPDFAAALDRAAVIRIAHQGRTLELRRKGEIWGIADRGDYPVLPARVHALLTGLVELRLIEPRTNDPADYPRLGLEDPSPTAGSTLLQVQSTGGTTLAALLIGHQRVRGGTEAAPELYLRHPGEARAWLAEGALEVDPDPQNWFDRDILNIDHDQVSAVAIAHGDTPALALVRAGTTLNLQSPPIPAGRTLDAAKLDDVAHALEFLSFTDVQPKAQEPGSSAGRATFTLADGETITARVRRAGEDVWARFDVAASDPKAAPKAAALQARLAGWAYKLGAWKAKALVPSLDDLLTPPAPAAPAAK